MNCDITGIRKPVIRILMVAVMLCTAYMNTVSAASVILDKPYCNHEAGTVTVSGSISSGSDKIVTLKVTKPGGAGQDYIAQTLSGEEGDFLFTYVLGENAVEQESYTVEVGGNGVTSVARGTFKYFGAIWQTQAKEAFNKATMSNIGECIQLYYEVLGVETGPGSDFYLLNDKTYVYQALIGRNFPNIPTIRAAFLNAVEEQKQKEITDSEIQAAVDLLNNASEEDISRILEENNNIYNLNFNSETYINIPSKSNIYKVLVNSDITSKTELHRIFNLVVAVEAMRQATGTNVEKIINENNFVLNLDLNGDYKSLPINTKGEVRKYLVGISFTGCDLTVLNGLDAALVRIREVFNAAVANVKAGNSVSGNNGGGGGGGGGGAKTPTLSTQFTATATVPENTDLPNIPDEKTSFIDIGTVPWAEEGIEQLASMGVINGYGNGIFMPDKNITRAEFVKILVVAFDLVIEGVDSNFSDVSAEDWFYPYVSSANHLGIALGDTDNMFGANREISRQEMVVMTYRTSSAKGIQIPQTVDMEAFSDEHEIAEYAFEAVSVMQQSGIINGIEPHVFAPLHSATRAMAAKVVYELMKLTK